MGRGTEGELNMSGIQFVIDEKGRKTGVLIDLKKHGAVWEDFWGGQPREACTSAWLDTHLKSSHPPRKNWTP